MSEKRMLIIDTEIARRIEENRGDMSISEFINLLIDSQLKNDNKFKQELVKANNNHITKEEFQQFEQGIRELLRNFLEFFLSYGLEIGKQSSDRELDRLSERLEAMGFANKSREL